MGARSLVFQGHIDTKPTGDLAAWKTPPYEPSIIDGRLYGLGAADMKAAIAAMVFAGRCLADSGALEGELRLLFTADEEAGAALGAKFLVNQIETADGILVGEPTGVEKPWEYLAVRPEGSPASESSCAGLRCIGSSDRLPSVNASVKLAGVLSSFARDFRPQSPVGSPWSAVANPGVTLEGGIYGVCPGEAAFGVDVRTVPGMTLDGLQAQVEEFLDRVRADDPQLEVEAEWPEDMAWFPPSSVEPARPLICAARAAAHEVLHKDLPDGIFPGGTEGWIGPPAPSRSSRHSALDASATLIGLMSRSAWTRSSPQVGFTRSLLSSSSDARRLCCCATAAAEGPDVTGSGRFEPVPTEPRLTARCGTHRRSQR